MTRPILGIDLSMTSTGVVEWHVGYHVSRIRTAKKDGSETERRCRIGEELATRAYNLWQNCGGHPLVVIETPVLTRFGSSLDVVMLHGVVLDHLYSERFETWHVPAATLKKHATGKGNADKAEMVRAAQAMGYEGKQPDEADAWCAAVFGRHLAGAEEHLTPLRSSCLQAASLVIGGGE